LQTSLAACVSPTASLGISSHSLFQNLQDCRHQTHSFAKNLSAEILTTQAHQDFSPIGWHLGHIAYTEAIWTAEYLSDCGLPPSHLAPEKNKQWDTLFAADGLPKVERQNLPKLKILLAYLETIRAYTLHALEQHQPAQTNRLWPWLIQHESQHLETMRMVLAMQQKKTFSPQVFSQPQTQTQQNASAMVRIEAGEFVQGHNAPAAIDNERPAHTAWTPTYWIDRTPVTYAHYQQFIAAGGYQTQKWWSPEGWQWQQQRQLSQPFYASQNQSFSSPFVCGISWYEADAYARFIGKRLPTESEWEKALNTKANCLQAFTHVWEWTNTWFSGYPNFRPFPYAGYSQAYFDGAHRVLKGGSWATPKWARRPSFRNWYHPHRREIFAGFRCVWSE